MTTLNRVMAKEDAPFRPHPFLRRRVRSNRQNHRHHHHHRQHRHRLRRRNDWEIRQYVSTMMAVKSFESASE